MSKCRVRTAIAVWVLYPAAYVGACFMGLMLAGLMPLLVGMPLLVASVLFALITLREMRALAVGTLLASCLQFVMSVMLLGGPGRTWFPDTVGWTHPGVPRPIAGLVWIVAMVLPLAITGVALCGLRRFTQRARSMGQSP